MDKFVFIHENMRNSKFKNCSGDVSGDTVFIIVHNEMCPCLEEPYNILNQYFPKGTSCYKIMPGCQRSTIKSNEF